MELYSYTEVFAYSKEYFKGEELPAKVFCDKYALKSGDKYLEATPDDMHHRIAQELARIEKNKFSKPMTHNEIYGYLKDFGQIIPQGSSLYGIGNKQQYVSLSNCFVLNEPVDSYGGILDVDQELVQISKRRGGVGISLNNLRPHQSPTQNSSGTSTGVCSFAERYSNSIREVGQNGRRGALMLTLNIHHPEIQRFIHCKDDATKVTGANISIQVTDEFMWAVKTKTKYIQQWPLNTKVPEISLEVDAYELWMHIIQCAHNRAEPGVLFWDTIINESPADCYAKFGFSTICTNPCSELPLCILDSCRLMIVNLMACVKNPYTKQAEFDFEKLTQLSMVLQRLMDDIVDLEIESIHRIINKIKNDPEDISIKKKELSIWKEVLVKCENGRRTGSGLTAVGDVIAALGFKYGSTRSIELVDEIYKTIKLACYRSSVDMAKELGPFPIWDASLELNCPFLLRIKDEDPVLYNEMNKYGRRNIALLTTAPTGSISLLSSFVVNDIMYFQTTSGIEPLFMESFTRRKKGNPSDNDFRSDFVDNNGDHWMHFEVNHPGIQAWMDVNGKDSKEGSPYVCANDINWKNRVKLQAAAQKHVDHAISSTINLPSDVSVEEVAIIYQTAWESGCKGVTVYRDGCRDGVLISSNTQEKNRGDDAVKRPKELPCDVHHHTVKGTEYFVLVGLLDGEPYEIFAGKNGFIDRKVKRGVITKKERPKCYKADFDDGATVEPITMTCDEEQEAFTRLVSCYLRHGAPLNFMVDQIEKTKGGLQSFSKAIARSLKKYIEDGTKSTVTCPTCESKSLFRQEGCVTCKQCGWSGCS